VSIDFTTKPLVHTIPNTSDVHVEQDLRYTTANGPLGFDLYRPLHATSPSPALVFVSGYPDPGMVAMLGKPLKEWASYQGWARMVAASGIAAITYENRDPADVFALIEYLRANASTLGLDPARIGVWACSGNVPMALGLMTREPFACAALLYGYLLDVDGATDVAQAAAQFRFAMPPVTIDDLPRETPMLVVRAGRDETPGLNATLAKFVAAASARGMPIELIDHPDAPHAFDIIDDTPASHDVIERVLAFLRRNLVG